MFQSSTTQIGLVILLVACGLAFWRGAWPERLAAAVILVAWIGCEAVEDFDFSHKAQPAIFIIDLALAMVLLALMWSTDRKWIVWAFAYQGLIVLTHVAAILDPIASRHDFFIAYYVWSYAVLAALSVGAIREGKRQTTFLPKLDLLFKLHEQ